MSEMNFSINIIGEPLDPKLPPPLYVKHANRSIAKKKRQGGGCHMCKPFKHGLESNFKPKQKQQRSLNEILAIDSN